MEITPAAYLGWSLGALPRHLAVPPFRWAFQVDCWRIFHLPMQEMRVQSLGGEDLLEKGLATFFRILACRIPWTEEPGGLQSMGSQSQTRLSE